MSLGGGDYFFGLHSGHLVARADRIAKRLDAYHVNHTEPRGERRGWFACRNRGEPFNSGKAREVMDAIERAGGIEGLLHKRDAVQSMSAGDIHPGWSAADAAAAEAEGWNVFECGDGQLIIEADQDSDAPLEDADAFVRERATEGSEVHKRALVLTKAWGST